MNKDECNHKTSVAGLTPRELAEGIASLRYDALRDFFQHLMTRIMADSFKDFHGNKRMLASGLRCLAHELEACWNECVDIDDTCSPHYTDKKNDDS